MARTEISVTELKCAVVDPDWRAEWIRGDDPPTLSFAAEGRSYGRKFHEVADQVTTWLCKLSPEKATALNSTEALWHQVHDRFIAGFLGDLAGRGQTEAALDFARRTESFCARVVALRHRRKAFSTWNDVFVVQEFAIPKCLVAGDGYEVQVSGRVDSVRFHPTDHMEVVDYKLSQGANQKTDMVQLAIYARLLELTRPGLKFSGALEYYLPEFHEVRVASEELNGIFGDLVEPVLAEMFPRPNRRPLPVVSLAPSAESGVAEAEIVRAFASFKLDVQVTGKIVGPQLLRYYLKPGSGVKVAALMKTADDLQVALGLENPPLIRPAKGYVSFDIPRPTPQPVLMVDLIQTSVSARTRSPVAIPIGAGVDGAPLIIDFADPNTCHVLVAGTSGSGKSEWLKSIVAALALDNSPSNIQFGIVDPKILTFSGIDGNSFLWRPLVHDLASAVSLLQSAVTEMEDRYHHLAREQVSSLSELWKKGKNRMPFLFLVFDEFADLILGDKELKKEFENLVTRIASKGRAAGVHLVLATQRPDRNVVTGLIKANLPLKICLRVTSSINSQIVLDEPGAEKLLGKGDLLCDRGKGIERAQGPFIPQDQFLKAMQVSKRMESKV